MTAFGVPAGAIRPNQPRFSKPGSVSAIVGHVRQLRRALLARHGERAEPALLHEADGGGEVGRGEYESVRRRDPPAPGPRPCTARARRRCRPRSRSSRRQDGSAMPTPAEPKVIDPGFAFASAISSLTFFAAEARVDGHDLRPARHVGDGHEVLLGIERHLAVDVLVGRHDGARGHEAACSRRAATWPRSRRRCCRPRRARLSTRICWPHASVSFCATSRVTMSVAPPGAKGTMMRTGLVG